MFSLFLAMVSTTWVAEVLLYIGIALSFGATYEYVRDDWAQLRGKPSTSA
jgi:hypothetical protein